MGPPVNPGRPVFVDATPGIEPGNDRQGLSVSREQVSEVLGNRLSEHFRQRGELFGVRFAAGAGQDRIVATFRGAGVDPASMHVSQAML